MLAWSCLPHLPTVSWWEHRYVMLGYFQTRWGRLDPTTAFLKLLWKLTWSKHWRMKRKRHVAWTPDARGLLCTTLMPKGTNVSNQGTWLCWVQFGQFNKQLLLTYASKSCLPGPEMEMSWSPACQEHMGHLLLRYTVTCYTTMFQLLISHAYHSAPIIV